MMAQQQENIKQRKRNNERIRNAGSSLTTTKKKIIAIFLYMIMSWVWVTIIDSSKHEDDRVSSQIKSGHSVTNREAEMERQVAQRKLDYRKTYGNGNGSNVIDDSSSEDVTNIGDKVEWRESKNTEEQSHHQYYCDVGFKPNNECFDILSPHLKFKKAWHFMGDSQMGYTFKEIISTYPYRKISGRTAPDERCGFLEYCYLEKRREWDVQGARLTQGPVLYGLSNHFCSDLSGFQNTMVEGDKNNFIEYLAIEFASDVEQQTPTTNTTQQSASLYLRNQLHHYDLTIDDRVCVVNVGLHDQNICAVPAWLRKEQCGDLYMRNVETYLKELDSVCGYIVWISTTSCMNSRRHAQRNGRSVDWNRFVESLLNRLYPEKSFFVDVWGKSSNTTHLDNIHLEASYYEELASLFTSLM